MARPSTAAGWPTRLVAATLAAALTSMSALLACESEPPPTAVLAALPTRDATTRDGLLTASMPVDLVLAIQDRSLFGTSADGSFRLYLEHMRGEPLPAVLGALKDELIGLGWEHLEEQHYESAVAVKMARGPKQHRLQRVSWLLEVALPTDDGKPQVILCEAIAGESQGARVGQPLRQLCEGLRLASPPTP